jgi:hypothetical protein
MSEFADVTIVGIAYGTTKRVLRHSSKLDTKSSQELEEVHGMTRDRNPVGFKRGKKTHSGTIVTSIGLPEEVDWDYLASNNIPFDLTYEVGDGGRRFTCVGCEIEDDDFSSDNGTGTEKTITFKMLRRQAAPSSLFG